MRVDGPPRFRDLLPPGGLQKITATIVDQGIVSLAGFLIHILLARSVSPSDYGVFVLAYSAIVLANELNHAVMLEPMMIFGPSAEVPDLEDYLRSATTMQIAFTVILMILIWSGCGVWLMFRGASPTLLVVALMPVGLMGVQGREFARKAFFTRLDARGALRNDILYVVLVIGSLVATIGAGRLNPGNAFLIIGLAGTITAIVGVMRQGLRPQLRAASIQRVTNLSWGYGRWMIAAAGARWSTGEFYYYVVAFFTGSAGAGALRAVQNLFAPISLFLIGIGNLLLPVASGLVEKTPQRVARFLAVASASLGVTTIGYVVVVTLGAREIIDFAYAGKYGAYAMLVPLVGVGHILVALLQGPTNGLRALQQPKIVFGISFFSAVVSIIAVFPMTARWNIQGAVMAWILSLLLAFPFWTRTCVSAVRKLEKASQT